MRVNEADIFVGDIQVMALIDTGSTGFHYYSGISVNNNGHDIYPMKQMLQLEGMGGVLHSIHGVYRSYC